MDFKIILNSILLRLIKKWRISSQFAVKLHHIRLMLLYVSAIKLILKINTNNIYTIILIYKFNSITTNE